MIRRLLSAGKGFHDMPLVLFTALALPAAGIGAGSLVVALTGAGGWGSGPPESAAVAGLLALGMGFSAAHLGRPTRALWALRKVGHSSLSIEVVVVATTVVAGMAVVILPRGSALAGAFGFLVPVLSTLVLVTLGLVYRLPGQLTWSKRAVLSPLVLGTVFGLVIHRAWGTWDEVGWVSGALVAFWILDVVLTGARGVGLERAGKVGDPSHPEFFDRRKALLGTRIVLVDILPLLALGLGWVFIAVPFLGLGILLDRLAFYGLAVERTTESELRRVEGVIVATGG